MASNHYATRKFAIVPISVFKGLGTANVISNYMGHNGLNISVYVLIFVCSLTSMNFYILLLPDTARHTADVSDPPLYTEFYCYRAYQVPPVFQSPLGPT